MKYYKLFVYGTLKRGHSLHRYMGYNAKFIGVDKVKGQLYTNGYLPYLFDEEGEAKGEVWRVDEDHYKMIYAIETNASYEEKQVTTLKGRKVRAYYIRARIGEFRKSEMYQIAEYIEENDYNL